MPPPLAGGALPALRLCGDFMWLATELRRQPPAPFGSRSGPAPTEEPAPLAPWGGPLPPPAPLAAVSPKSELDPILDGRVLGLAGAVVASDRGLVPQQMR
jgi:hypothetical protein